MTKTVRYVLSLIPVDPREVHKVQTRIAMAGERKVKMAFGRDEG